MKYVVNTCICLWQNRPSVIVGLNQNPYAEVDVQYLEAHHITLARRVTGGGAVYHDLGNLNYSIAGPIAAMEDKFCSAWNGLQRNCGCLPWSAQSNRRNFCRLLYSAYYTGRKFY